MEAYETKGYLKLQFSPLTPYPLSPHHPPHPPFPFLCAYHGLTYSLTFLVLICFQPAPQGLDCLRLVYSSMSDAYLRTLHTVGTQATLMTG